jgi:hypothetical protein
MWYCVLFREFPNMNGSLRLFPEGRKKGPMIGPIIAPHDTSTLVSPLDVR